MIRPTRGEAVAWSVIVAYLLVGVWGVLIAAGALPAAPWSPIGRGHGDPVPHTPGRIVTPAHHGPQVRA